MTLKTKNNIKKLLKDSGFSGIKVIEFAFDSRDTGFKNDYLPHNYPENCVAYTSTHDNQTLFSWLKDLKRDDISTLRKYVCDFFSPRERLIDSLIALIMRSEARLCIVPLYDYLALDDRARINTPSTIGNNWRWRVKKDFLIDDNTEEIKDITTRYGRI